MLTVSLKEIYKEFNLAKRHFKRAIELSKKGVVVGEINFPEKKSKVRKVTPRELIEEVKNDRT